MPEKNWPTWLQALPLPSLSSTQGAWLLHRSSWFNLAVPVMPRLWEPGPSPCPPHSPHGQPLLDSLSHSRPPAASSLLTTAPPVLATPFWLLLRCWCSPKHPSSPPTLHQIPSRPHVSLLALLPSSGLGSLQSQLYLRTSPAATNMGWLPKGLYFSSLAPTSSKSLLLPLASRGIQANTSAGLTVLSVTHLPPAVA